jgi:hypothetical protein
MITTQANKPKHLRVALGFTQQTDHKLEELAGAVLAGMTGNKEYPSPPVDMAMLHTALTDFTVAIAAQATGGKQATLDKNTKRHALIVLLRKLASYVQGNCNDDETILLSSGFKIPASGARRPQINLSKPVFSGVDNGHTTQLVLKVKKDPNGQAYELRIATITGATTGPWQSAGVFTDPRVMTVTNLTPATKYAFQVRAVGRGNVYSDWSDPVSHMYM